MDQTDHPEHADRTGVPQGAYPQPAPDAVQTAELLARIRELEEQRDRLRVALARAEEAVNANLLYLRTIADSTPAILWVTDVEHRCTFLNRRWTTFTGQSREQGRQFGWLEMVHPEDRERTRHAFLQAAERRSAFSVSHRLRCADGRYRWVADEGAPRFDESGEFQGYVGAVTDVHELRLAIEAVQASETRYRTLFDSIDEGFCVLEMIFDGDERAVDYRFVEMNPAFARHTGLENAVGHTARELIPGLEEHWFEIYGRVAVTGKPVRFTNVSEAMDRWFDVFAFRVDDPALRRVALLFTDITEYKRSETERTIALKAAETSRREAEAANRAKSEFLAAMSHELRTPLNAIGGYVELLDLGIHGTLTESQHGALERITVNQRHLLTLINDVLSFARVEAGEIRFDLREGSAHALLESLGSLVFPQAEARGITYTVEECSPEIAYLGDVERVRQILLNLIGNAIKFTPAGGRVVVGCTTEAERVRFHVRDNGPGIDPADQDRIFDPFQQVGRRLNQPRDGVGLGLAISRDLALGMGGDLTVESTLGSGATFTLLLPRGDPFE